MCIRDSEGEAHTQIANLQRVFIAQVIRRSALGVMIEDFAALQRLQSRNRFQ